MPLTDDQRRAIRDEETFRLQVQKELAGVRPPPTPYERISAFFDSKAGFWLLTTALAGLATTGLAGLQHYLNREEIEARQEAERALRDTDTLLKLGPMLTSDKRSQVEMAIVLLDGLDEDLAVDTRVSRQIKALVRNTLDAGLKSDASAEEKAQADAILAYVDNRARAETAQVASATESPAQPTSIVAAAVSADSLPVRVYIQIADAADQPAGERSRDVLRAAGFIVPGIEVVGSKAPARDDLRYCADKVTTETLGRVEAAAAQLDAKPRMIALNPRLCGAVRFNHFELWLSARPALPQ